MEETSVSPSRYVPKKSWRHFSCLLLVCRDSWTQDPSLAQHRLFSSPEEVADSSPWHPVTFKLFSFLPCYIIERFASTAESSTVLRMNEDVSAEEQEESH